LFLLDDDTGACVIDPDGAEVTPGISETWYESRPARPLDTFKVHPSIDVLSKTLTRASAPYRYTELRLNINEANKVIIAATNKAANKNQSPLLKCSNPCMEKLNCLKD